jgi:hypothetical protein
MKQRQQFSASKIVTRVEVEVPIDSIHSFGLDRFFGCFFSPVSEKVNGRQSAEAPFLSSKLQSGL